MEMNSTTLDSRRLLITGANGYIGRRLVHAAHLRGFEVVAAVRDPHGFAPEDCVAVRRFDLTLAHDVGDSLSGVDAVIHLAAILGEDSKPADADEDRNVSGTRRLIEAARKHGVSRFVFLSSQSAAPDSPTRYGRSKWQIEQLLTGPGECSVRTGLVSGGPARGVYGVLFRMAKRFPVLPVIRPGAPVYPIHVDDLCQGLLSLVQQKSPHVKLMRLAASASMPFGEYVRTLARNRLGKRLRLLAIPPRLILALSRLTEAVPLLPTVSRERVLGLIALRPMEIDSIPAPPDATPSRDVAQALAAEGLRRRLLVEARVLMSYALGSGVPPGVLRRYVRAVLAENDHSPIDFSCCVRMWPALLRTIEPVGQAEHRLGRRLAIATRIVEMTRVGAPRFHNYRERSRWMVWPALLWLLTVEALLLPLRWVARRFASRRGRGTD